MSLPCLQSRQIRPATQPLLTMPRPPTPPEILKLRGTFRKDRHGERDAAAQPEGVIDQPGNLDSLGLRMWGTIRDKLLPLGYLTSADQPMVDLCCRLWSLLQNAMAAAQLDPADKDARASVVAYSSQWLACAAKVGLSPQDRLKLAPATKRRESHDAADEFFGPKLG